MLMPRTRRQDERDTPAPEPRPETPRPVAPVDAVLALQRSAGNQAAARLIQRVHPAFNEVNYWRMPLPALDGGQPEPHPLSPDGVLKRLTAEFGKPIAELLLHTDAPDQDAVAREPMTRKFLAEGGTAAEAIQHLAANPADNAALQTAFTQVIQSKRDALTTGFLGEGGTPTRAGELQTAHPTGVAPLKTAYHDDRSGDLRGRASVALKSLSDLEALRGQMISAKAFVPPPGVLDLRGRIDTARKKLMTGGDTERGEMDQAIRDTEAWVNARQGIASAIDPSVRTIIADSYDVYGEARAIVKALFVTAPFDNAAYLKAYADFAKTVPMKRSAQRSPGQIIDEYTGRLVTLWGVADAVARPYANKLFSNAGGATLAQLEAGVVTKATWDALEAELQVKGAMEAVEKLQTAAALAALVQRLNLSTLNGANLTAIALNAPTRATLHRGTYFPYKRVTPWEIETEISVSWNNDLWMPTGKRHWGEVHIHYNGTVAAQAAVRYVHVKIDRSVPGGTAIGPGHAVVAHAYANGLVDPTWHI
jgi:hypothetical protein